MQTAFGRLWARAPLWRWAVIATAMSGALTIAFPPLGLKGTASVAEAPSQQIAAPPVAATPQAPAAPARPASELGLQAPVADAGASTLPVAGAIYSGRLPMGAQSVPLPLGRWVAVVVGTSNPAATTGPPTASVFLVLIQGHRIVSAAVISGSTAPDPQAAGFPAPLEVQIPSFYYRRVESSVDHGALDVWVCGATQAGRWTEPVRQAALKVFRQQALTLPDRVESVVFRFADMRNWVSADFMFADPAPTSDPVRPWTEVAAMPDTGPLSHVEKVRRWGKAWHDIMRRAFAGTLRPGDEAQIMPP